MRNRIVLAVLVTAILGYMAHHQLQAQSPSPKLNLVVVCMKCIPDAMPQEAYNAGNIVLDQNTGDLWFYPAFIPGTKPTLLGRFTAPGQPLAPPAK